MDDEQKVSGQGLEGGEKCSPTPALPEGEGEMHPTPGLPEGEGNVPSAVGAAGAVHGLYTANPRIYGRLKGYAREMRSKPTAAERILWRELRGEKLGTNFRRQHVLGNFIVDFVSLDRRLVIEVDGDIHDQRKEEDALRTQWLNQSSFHVLRFRNEEVLRQLTRVLQRIRQVVEERPSLRSTSLPSGEG